MYLTYLTKTYFFQSNRCSTNNNSNNAVYRFGGDGSETVFNIWLVERVHLHLIFIQKDILCLKKLIEGQKRPIKAVEGQ